VEAAGVDPAAVEAARDLQRQGDVRSMGEILVAHGSLSPAAAAEVIESQRESRAISLGDTSIRVDVGLLDKLMNLVGELVLARNQIVQFASRGQDPSFLHASQRLDLITTELQGGAMKTRMQPIGNLWSRLPRVVRDLAVAGGKQIRVEMVGEDTELDKTLIEAIKDPLTHVVRNSADHGIEPPEQRALAGKSSEGCIFLRAFHEGGQVNIEISDDGAGVNLELVKQKALAKGLITTEQATRMTERELANLVFLPGLSTAEKVTSVSGRGVGMDVVKTNVEKIGGTVDLHSRAGQGTTLRIKIPLTLAIIPALIVTCGGDRYAIPQVSLLELVRLDGDDVRRRIEAVQGVPVYRLRGNLLPLVYLERELRISPAPKTEPEGHSAAGGSPVSIVVLQADGRQFGLVVDDISDTEEIVVKPLSKQLKSINTFAGATIMGDGKVALILDVLGLAQHAQVLSEARDRAVSERDAISLQVNEIAHRNAVLLFQCGECGRMAIDLGLVARLEEFPDEMVEFAANQEVVQYRGEIMPLIRVADVLEKKPRKPLERTQEDLHVIVYSARGRSVGLVVDRILDIVEESFVMQRQTWPRGIQGSAIIQKRVTDILDVPSLIAAVADHTTLATIAG
jgi:two-component system chemotaxis sensor kinase CheA